MKDILKKSVLDVEEERQASILVSSRLNVCRNWYLCLNEDEAEKYKTLNPLEKELFKVVAVDYASVKEKNEEYSNEIKK